MEDGLADVSIAQGEDINDRGDNGFAAGQPAEEPEELAPPSEGKFRCTVVEPEKKGEGMQQYIAYRVHTVRTDADGAVSQSSVIRRYSDFLWLHTELTNTNKGVLIPTLPEKVFMRRFTQDFVDERRRWLEIFLNRVACSEHLCNAPAVALFLHGDDSDMALAKEGNGLLSYANLGSASEPEGAAPPAKGFMNMFREGMMTLSNTFGATKERERNPEDDECDGVMAYANSLETSLTEMHDKLQELVGKNKDLAKNWFQFGLACTLLGQYENDQNERKLGDTFAKVGHISDRLSVLVTEKVDKENVEFREHVKDYIRMVGAVKAMMKGRENAALTHQAAVATLESKQAKLAGLQDVAGKEEAALAAEKRVLEAQQAVDAAKAEMDRVTQLCLSEAVDFRERKQEDLRRIVEAFVEVQLKHSQKVQAAWESILPSIQNT